MPEGGYSIRFYRPSDAPFLGEIFTEAILGIDSGIYAAPQKEAWAANRWSAEEAHAACTDGRTVWIAADLNDNPVAFMDLEPDGHLDMMFCRPAFQHRGIATALFGRLEKEALSRGIRRITVEASERAKPFFLGRGFSILRRNNLEVRGIAMHNYDMAKDLPPESRAS